MAGLLEYTKNGQVTEPPLYRFMRGNVQSFLNSIPDPSKMTPEQQLAMGLNANPIMGLLGTTAYHGSPYLFKQFDPNKIGSGEGAQVYGHGIYFAENPSVAQSYANSVKNTEKLGNIWRQIGYAKDKLNKAIEAGNTEEALKFRDLSNKLHTQFAQNNMMSRGNLYKVDIPDQDIPKMLDWDKPINEQSKEVQKALAPYIKEYGLPMNETGSSAHSMMLEIIGKREGLNADAPLSEFRALAPQVSKELNKAGIKGIKYLDEGSRELGQGTSNFVVFDPSNVKILERKKGLLK